MLNVGPRGNDGAENHQTEGEEGHVGDGATKPEDLTVGDQNDGQVLEDGIDGDGQELEGLGAGVDHADQQKGNREPYQRERTMLVKILIVAPDCKIDWNRGEYHTLLGLVGVEVTVGNQTHRLARLDGKDTDNGLLTNN